MSVELYEDALGDARNARTLATASELAYLSAEPGVAAFRERLGLEGHLVSVDNHQGWVCSSPEHIVVAFRGTESPTSLDGLKDWLLTDAANLPTVSLVGNPYQHCQTEVAPAESASATESASAFLSSLASRTVDGVLNATLIDDIWNALQQRLAAHFLDSYQALVASLFKK